MIKLKSLLEQIPDSVMDRRLGIGTTPKMVDIYKLYDTVIRELTKVIPSSLPSWMIHSTQNNPIGFILSISDFLKKNPSVNDNLAKVLIALIFAETKNSDLSYLSFKEIGGWLDNTFFGGNRSQGVAQIKPDTLKQYGFDPDEVDIFDHRDTLDILYKMITTNKTKSKSLYQGSEITHYDSNNKLITSPAIAGDAALHAAIVAHNSGDGILQQWCQTDKPGIANHCNIASREPNPKDEPGKVAKTYQNKKITNYIPYKNVYGKKINDIYNMKSLDMFLLAIRKLP